MEEKTNITKTEEELRISDLTKETIVPARKIIIEKIEKYEKDLEKNRKDEKIKPIKTAIGLLLAIAIGSTLSLHMVYSAEKYYFEELNIIERILAYLKDIPFPFTSYEAFYAIPLDDQELGTFLYYLFTAIAKPLSIIGTLILSIGKKLGYKETRQETTKKIEELYKIKEIIDKVAKEKFGIDIEKEYAEYTEELRKEQEEALRKEQEEALRKEQEVRQRQEMSTPLGFNANELAAAIKKR